MTYTFTLNFPCTRTRSFICTLTCTMWLFLYFYMYNVIVYVVVSCTVTCTCSSFWDIMFCIFEFGWYVKFELDNFTVWSCSLQCDHVHQGYNNFLLTRWYLFYLIYSWNLSYNGSFLWIALLLFRNSTTNWMRATRPPQKKHVQSTRKKNERKSLLLNQSKKR